jgi:hypothetical protein
VREIEAPCKKQADESGRDDRPSGDRHPSVPPENPQKAVDMKVDPGIARGDAIFLWIGRHGLAKGRDNGGERKSELRIVR